MSLKSPLLTWSADLRGGGLTCWASSTVLLSVGGNDQLAQTLRGSISYGIHYDGDQYVAPYRAVELWKRSISWIDPKSLHCSGLLRASIWIILANCPNVRLSLSKPFSFPSVSQPTNISVCCLKNCTKLVKTFLYKAPFTFSASLHRSNIRYILPLCLSLLTDVFSPVVRVFKNSHWFLASSMGVGSLAVQLMDNTTATFVIMNPLWQAT